MIKNGSTSGAATNNYRVVSVTPTMVGYSEKKKKKKKKKTFKNDQKWRSFFFFVYTSVNVFPFCKILQKGKKKKVLFDEAKLRFFTFIKTYDSIEIIYPDR